MYDKEKTSLKIKTLNKKNFFSYFGLIRFTSADVSAKDEFKVKKKRRKKYTF
jgi:hypothetical protein